MKKKNLLIVVIAVVFCLTACAGADTPATVESTEAAPGNPMAGLTLGMTPEQFLLSAEALHLALVMPDYETNPIPADAEDPARDGRIYNWTDYSFYYCAADYAVTFSFTPAGTLAQISVWDAAVPTAEGLSVGDSLERMEALYGTDYRKDPEDTPVFQYRTAEGYLNFFCQDSQITGWSLSLYPNINND